MSENTAETNESRRNEQDSGNESFELTEDNRGIGAVASIIIFARSTGRRPEQLSGEHFEEYTAWVNEHPDETPLSLKVNFQGPFEKLTEHVTEVTEEEIETYKKHVNLT